MATKYCDHGLYGAYAATPTWGSAQEGDGTAIAAATPASVSINMTGWTFTSGSSTFSVMGCTALTVGAGANSATNAQYSATLTTMIDNLAAAINLATATVVNVPAGWVASQVRNHVYARRNGNALELMTRAGSASWNSLVAMTFSNVTGSSSQSWSGGAGGAWGYLFNLSTMWASALAIGTYGLWGSSTLPLAGSVANGDMVMVRSAKTITVTTANSISPKVMGSMAAPVDFVIDDGTVWSADGSTPVLEVAFNNSPGYNLSFNINQSNQYIRTWAKRYSNDNAGLRFSSNATTGSNGVYAQVAYGNAINGVDVVCNGGGQASVQANAGYTDRALISDFKVTCKRDNNVFILYANSSNTDFVRGVCDATGSSAASSGVVQLPSSGSANGNVRGVAFKGFVVGSALVTGQATGTTPQVSFDDCELGNVTARGPFLSLLTRSGGPQASQVANYLTSGLRRSTRDFFVDTFTGFVAWNALRTQPTLNALLDDGITPYSILMLPSALAANVNPSAPLESPRLIKVNSLSDGARTITLHFVAEAALSVTKARISALVYYTATDGSQVLINTFDPTAPACDTDSVTWTGESGGYVTYQNGGMVNHSKYKLVIPTLSGRPMKAGTEVSVVVRIHQPGANATQTYFICPEFDIT